jgi:gliding motility-associated-like protein
MRKVYSLMILLFLLVFTGKESYATDYYPNSLIAANDAVYCVPATPVPLTAYFTQTSCSGSAFAIAVNYTWYVTVGGITTPVVGGSGVSSTTTLGGNVFLPSITPSAALGLYKYFCVITWGASGCIGAGSDTSNNVTILVGPPQGLQASISNNPACSGDSIYFIPGLPPYGATGYSWAGPTGSGYLVHTVINPPPYLVNDADNGIWTFSASNACGTTTETINLVVNDKITSISATATPNPFCSGGTLNLAGTVTGSSGVTSNFTYLWTGPNGFTSTLLSPTSFTGYTVNSGVYTLTVTPGGCPAKTDTTAYVQIDSAAITAYDSVPTPICSGYYVTLFERETYGTHFLWTGPNGFISTSLNPAPFPAVAASAGVYTLEVTNSCGVVTVVSDTLKVLPSPAPITGAAPYLCAGSSLYLADTTIGGWWFSSNTSVATVNTVGGVTSGSPGKATIYYITGVGCYDSVNITVSTPPAAILAPDKLCVGDTALFSDAVPGGTWSTSNTSVMVIGATTGDAVGQTSGNVTVDYTTPGCPPATFIVSVNPSPGPISGGTHVCLTGTLQLGDTPGGGIWSSRNAVVATVDGSGLVTGESVGADVISYDVNGCYSVLRIRVDSLPVFSIVGPDSICWGSCGILYTTSDPRNTFLWKPGNGISCTACDTTNACPLETQTYTVVVTNRQGCTDSETHRLTINPLPVVNYSPNPFYMCNGVSKTMNLTTTTPVSALSWYPNVAIETDTMLSPRFFDTTDLVYTLYATSTLGCRDSFKIPVSVLDSAITTLSGDTIICLGNEAHLIATSTDPTTTYKWFKYNYPADSSFPFTLSSDTAYNPIAKPDTTTSYEVMITENACFTVDREVTVYVDSMPNLYIANPGTIIAGSSITLTVTTNRDSLKNNDTGMIYTWAPPETVSCPSCPSTAVTPTVTTTYSVCVTSNRGCMSCDTVLVGIMCDGSQVFVPNTFTPNGDGFNDRFYVSGKGLGLITHMTVYNRWGQVMYDVQNIPANEAAYGWDGTYQGQVLEPDVFMYTLQIKCEAENVTFQYHGDISIVR